MTKINEVCKDRFDIWDGSGYAITGLVKADFNILLHNQDRTEVSSTILVGITEIESGLYESDFTPTSQGIYSLKIKNNDYLPTTLLAIYEVNDSNFDTIEDKIDILDANVDLILEDTSGLEGNLSGLMDEKTTLISGYISNHNDNLDSNFDILSGIINTSETSLSGVINESDQQISGYIINSETNISGYIINEHTTTRSTISTSESNIRGTDNDDLKILSEQIDSIQNSIFVNFKVPESLRKPDSGTIKYIFILDIFDSDGHIEVPDFIPTFKLEYSNGTIIIAETDMSFYPTGQYYYEYDLPHDQINGVVIATAKVIENSATKYFKQSSIINDYLSLESISINISDINDNIDLLENEILRALGLMQENQKIITLTKTITGKMLTGIKYLYTDNTMLVLVATYDITITYDNNDQAIEFNSVKR